jgi:tetrahydromethanopterin S-methyltransferase subunit B
MGERMAVLEQKLDQRVSAVEQRLDQRITAVEQKLGERIAGVEQRMGAMESRLLTWMIGIWIVTLSAMGVLKIVG